MPWVQFPAQLGTAGPPITASSAHPSSSDAAALHEAAVLEAACKAFYCACMSPLLILIISMQLDLKKKPYCKVHIRNNLCIS